MGVRLVIEHWDFKDLKDSSEDFKRLLEASFPAFTYTEDIMKHVFDWLDELEERLVLLASKQDGRVRGLIIGGLDAFPCCFIPYDKGMDVNPPEHVDMSAEAGADVHFEQCSDLMLILAEEQRKGIGSELYSAFERCLRNNGMREVWVLAYRGSRQDSSHKFFSKNGFADVIDVNDFYLCSDNYDTGSLQGKTATVMNKKL